MGAYFILICEMNKFLVIPNLFKSLFYAIKSQVVLINTQK